VPLELQVIRASEFVRLGAREHLDFKASKEALRILAFACWKRGLECALLDLRELPIPPKPLFTPAELASLVDTFREVGFSRRHRLAVLYRVDIHGGARMFAFISRMRGWRVQAFDDFERALLWLSEPTSKQAERGEQIPIRPAKTALRTKAASEVPIRRAQR
jgi:hypothetical protein